MELFPLAAPPRASSGSRALSRRVPQARGSAASARRGCGPQAQPVEVRLKPIYAASSLEEYYPLLRRKMAKHEPSRSRDDSGGESATVIGLPAGNGDVFTDRLYTLDRAGIKSKLRRIALLRH